MKVNACTLCGTVGDMAQAFMCRVQLTYVVWVGMVMDRDPQTISLS
jgi:hypothetical protein